MNKLKDLLEDDIKPNLEEENIGDLDKADYLQTLLTNACTQDGPIYNDHYESLRKYFMGNKKTKTYLPDYVIKSRDIGQFWQFIKYKFPTYAERRQYIWNSFNDLLEFLEEQAEMPFSETIDSKLMVFNSEHVLGYWKTAIERKEKDPEGAITLSRTLMESVLKHILEERGVSYKANADLHEIYKAVTNELNLSPEQHDITLFKQILGGCSSIVSGLGNLRNNHGDAHGKGKVTYYKPSSRHAELAVNLSGSMCLFLIQTFQHVDAN
jgi:hypothetical protein